MQPLAITSICVGTALLCSVLITLVCKCLRKRKSQERTFPDEYQKVPLHIISKHKSAAVSDHKITMSTPDPYQCKGVTARHDECLDSEVGCYNTRPSESELTQRNYRLVHGTPSRQLTSFSRTSKDGTRNESSRFDESYCHHSSDGYKQPNKSGKRIFEKSMQRIRTLRSGSSGYDERELLIPDHEQCYDRLNYERHRVNTGNTVITKDMKGNHRCTNNEPPAECIGHNNSPAGSVDVSRTRVFNSPIPHTYKPNKPTINTFRRNLKETDNDIDTAEHVQYCKNQRECNTDGVIRMDSTGTQNNKSHHDTSITGAGGILKNSHAFYHEQNVRRAESSRQSNLNEYVRSSLNHTTSEQGVPTAQITQQSRHQHRHENSDDSMDNIGASHNPIRSNHGVHQHDMQSPLSIIQESEPRHSDKQMELSFDRTTHISCKDKLLHKTKLKAEREKATYSQIEPYLSTDHSHNNISSYPAENLEQNIKLVQDDSVSQGHNVYQLISDKSVKEIVEDVMNDAALCDTTHQLNASIDKLLRTHEEKSNNRDAFLEINTMSNSIDGRDAHGDKLEHGLDISESHCTDKYAASQTTTESPPIRRTKLDSTQQSNGMESHPVAKSLITEEVARNLRNRESGSGRVVGTVNYEQQKCNIQNGTDDRTGRYNPTRNEIDVTARIQKSRGAKIPAYNSLPPTPVRGSSVCSINSMFPTPPDSIQYGSTKPHMLKETVQSSRPYIPNKAPATNDVFVPANHSQTSTNNGELPCTIIKNIPTDESNSDILVINARTRKLTNITPCQVKRRERETDVSFDTAKQIATHDNEIVSFSKTPTHSNTDRDMHRYVVTRPNEITPPNTPTGTRSIFNQNKLQTTPSVCERVANISARFACPKAETLLEGESQFNTGNIRIRSKKREAWSVRNYLQSPSRRNNAIISQTITTTSMNLQPPPQTELIVTTSEPIHKGPTLCSNSNVINSANNTVIPMRPSFSETTAVHTSNNIPAATNASLCRVSVQCADSESSTMTITGDPSKLKPDHWIGDSTCELIGKNKSDTHTKAEQLKFNVKGIDNYGINQLIQSCEGNQSENEVSEQSKPTIISSNDFEKYRSTFAKATAAGDIEDVKSLISPITPSNYSTAPVRRLNCETSNIYGNVDSSVTVPNFQHKTRSDINIGNRKVPLVPSIVSEKHRNETKPPVRHTATDPEVYTRQVSSETFIQCKNKEQPIIDDTNVDTYTTEYMAPVSAINCTKRHYTTRPTGIQSTKDITRKVSSIQSFTSSQCQSKTQCVPVNDANRDAPLDSMTTSIKRQNKMQLLASDTAKENNKNVSPVSPATSPKYQNKMQLLASDTAKEDNENVPPVSPTTSPGYNNKLQSPNTTSNDHTIPHTNTIYQNKTKLFSIAINNTTSSMQPASSINVTQSRVQPETQMNKDDIYDIHSLLSVAPPKCQRTAMPPVDGMTNDAPPALSARSPVNSDTNIDGIKTVPPILSATAPNSQKNTLVAINELANNDMSSVSNISSPLSSNLKANIQSSPCSDATDNNFASNYLALLETHEPNVNLYEERSISSSTGMFAASKLGVRPDDNINDIPCHASDPEEFDQEVSSFIEDIMHLIRGEMLAHDDNNINDTHKCTKTTGDADHDSHTIESDCHKRVHGSIRIRNLTEYEYVVTLPKKIANVKEIMKDPAVDAIMKAIRLKRKSLPSILCSATDMTLNQESTHD